jgi:hypothetical protein
MWSSWGVSLLSSANAESESAWQPVLEQLQSVDQNLIRAAAEKISADLDSADSIDLRKYRDP